MKRKPYKPVQVIEGVWYALMDEQTSECCDCGLVHETEWKVEKGRLFYRTKVNRRLTTASRRASGIKVVRASAKPD